MNQKLFTIYDKKVAVYTRPIFCRSVGEATRAFSDAVNDDKTEYGKHFEDFCLYELGDYDDTTGIVVGHPPVAVVEGASLRNS